MKSSRAASAIWAAWTAICLLAVGCGKQGESEVGDQASKTPPPPQSQENPGAINLPFQQPRPFVPDASLAGKSRNDTNYLREWNRFTLVEDYRRIGKTNAAWDAPAVGALESFAEVRSLLGQSERQRTLLGEIRTRSAAAVAAGCDDPLVKYLHIRFLVSQSPGRSDALLAKSYEESAVAIEALPYAPVRKLYVNLRAAESLKASVTNTPPRLMQLRRATVHHLQESLHDESMPPLEAAEFCRQIWSSFSLNQSIREEIEAHVTPTLDRLWSNHAFAHLLKGHLLIKKAWDARGGGDAPKATEDGWKEFKASLDLAETELRRAWDLDKTDAAIPVAMITACLGLSHPREEMEVWFKRAMEIDPRSYEAAFVKSTFLEPKWHGSEEALLEFGRECVSSAQWKGSVPLVLPKAHERLALYLEKDKRDSYWLKPGVWEDTRRGYERFFELNPTDTSYRHDYARAAYNCGQYQTFLAQLPRFEGTNYSFFGGKEKFDEMVRTAQAKTGAK